MVGSLHQLLLDASGKAKLRRSSYFTKNLAAEGKLRENLQSVMRAGKNALADSGYVFEFRAEALTDKSLDLIPKVRITLALHMTWGEGAVDPGHALAANGILPVIEAIVTQNLGFRIVGSANERPAMDDPVRLVEVRCGCYVVWNEAVVLPGLGYGIDLHSQHDGNAGAVEITG